MTQILWDYHMIDASHPIAIKKELERKIMFGKFDESDIPHIKLYMDTISMTPYWRHYLIIYLRKYDTHPDSSTIS
jgi:hypothetical protein